MKNHSNYSVLLMQPWLNYRGAETVSMHLCEDLNKSGVEAKILCLYVSTAAKEVFPENLLVLPPRFLQKIMQNKIVFILFGFWALLLCGVFYSRRFTFFNPHNFPSVWVAVICAFLYRKKIVWTVHNFPQHPFRGLSGVIYEAVIQPVDKILVSRIDVVSAVSKKVSQQILERYGKKSVVIYPGIDTAYWQQKQVFPFAGELEKVESFAQGKKILLHVGQVRPEKRQDFTVKVFNMVASQYSNLVLVFVGERILANYPDISHLSESVQARILFIERMPRDYLRTLYQHVELLFSPSSWGEGCTLIPLEAMASGVNHVVVSPGCGVDELMTQYRLGGVLADNSVEIAAKAIIDKIEVDMHQNYSSLLLFSSRKRFVQEYLDIFERDCSS